MNTTNFNAYKLPLNLEIFESKIAPGIAINCISRTPIIKPILALAPSPQLTSLVPKYTATNIIVCTAIL